MPPFDLGNDIVQRRGINTSGGINPNAEFEQRFSQQQNPFGEEFGGGNLSRIFRGQERNQSGRFNFGNFTGQQLELGRATAFNQLFNTQLSGQQNDAVAAVQKNRIARGLRGKAAEAAARQAQQRFASGNRREALSFITEDFQRNNPAFREFQATGQGGEEGLGALDFIAQSRAVQLLSQFGSITNRNAAVNRANNVTGGEVTVAEQNAVGDNLRGQGSVEQNFLGQSRVFAGGGVQGVDTTDTGLVNSAEFRGSSAQLDSAVDAFNSQRQDNRKITDLTDLAGGADAFSRIRESGGEGVGTLLDQLVGSVKSNLIDGRIGGRDDVDAFADIFGVDDTLFRDTFQKSSQQITPFSGGGRTTEISRPNLFGGRTDRTAGDLDDRIAFTEKAILRQQDQVTRQQGNPFLRGNDNGLGARRNAQSNIDVLQSQLSKFQAQRRDLGLLQNTLFSPLI